MPTGRLIILNGGSSAGKTSLGRAMQDLLPDCHRHAGWNRGSARAAHAHAIYDFAVDTTSSPPNVLAQQLVDQLAACPSPTAFAALRARLA